MKNEKNHLSILRNKISLCRNDSTSILGGLQGRYERFEMKNEAQNEDANDWHRGLKRKMNFEDAFVEVIAEIIFRLMGS